MSQLKHMQAVKANRKDKPILVKMSEFERRRAQDKADKYTGGNVSEWLRYAATLDPRPEDVLAAQTAPAAEPVAEPAPQ